MIQGNPGWPVLRAYDQDHLARIALPLGGIGTGTVSLGGRGDLRDWEVMNRPAKGFAPANTFFAVHARPAGWPAFTRCLEGPIEDHLFEGDHGSRATNHGLPRFRRCAFLAAYPFGQALLSDPEAPVEARIEAFNPLVPPDAEASGLPVAVLRFVLRNRTARRVQAAVCGSIQNFIGRCGASGVGRRNRNAFRRGGPVQGLFLTSDGVDPADEFWGTMALATTSRAAVTWRAAWAEGPANAGLLDFWDDFSEDGALDPRPAGAADEPFASLAVPLRLAPRGEASVTFLLAWRFPNRLTWTPRSGPKGVPIAERVGNQYATRFPDAWAAAEHAAARLRDLESRTLAFVRAFCQSDLPAEVKEAALFNLSTLRSQTCFRTEDGRFYGWEGCHDGRGCCHGSCTHVWNYEHATGFLFGDLARSMREVEFLHATDDRGCMSFRVNLPLERAKEFGVAAADGQMGCLMRLYREWRLSGDDAWLRRLWPAARKALEFCWVPGGWDADQDGVMEGCQHNTMDVEYFGPNPQMGVWYLGALRAVEEMARHLREDGFATRCRDFFERGRRWTDANLFNGRYYEHHVRPAASEDAVAKGLRLRNSMVADVRRPDFQLGAGCLVDQLVGQFTAHVCGLGRLLDPPHARTTLRSILRYNRRRNLFGHFNYRRTYAAGDESALLMSTYPMGRRPARPFPYATEVMTGFEYAAAVHMLYEGMIAEGLRTIRDIRARYDGRRRSPFDEAECGHHYARAMASWAAVPALTGFQYSGQDLTMRFARSDGPARWFWSNGGAWGVCEQRPGRDGARVVLTVAEGRLALRRFEIAGLAAVEWSRPRRLRSGQRVALRLSGAP